MSFEVDADDYDRFMGRFSGPLAVGFASYAGVRPGRRVLDVGCGPGALSERLVELVGPDAVTAVDPSVTFVEAARRRLAGVRVLRASAESLPLADASFDAALAQLVVHFMTDPVAGLREMARVTRPGGTVAACVWDHAGGGGPLATFWRAAGDLDPAAPGEGRLPGARQGHLGVLFRQAGLDPVEEGSLEVRVGYASFGEWWAPYTSGVGPAGAYVATLDEERREALRARCAQLLPQGTFEVPALAWAARARA